jgi:PAS domain S-box-containing protein
MARAAKPRGRITIIDDHPEFLALMQDLLSVRYDVVGFSGSELGPDDIVDSRPDLLIVDLRLDRRDLQGWDIVALARADRHLRTIPIVVCSADENALNARAGALLNAGNTAVLIKPFTVDAIEEIVRQGLRAGFPRAEVGGSGRDGYRRLLDTSRDAVLVTDQSGRYIDANEAALDMLGLTRDQLCRLSVGDLVAMDAGWTDAEWQRYRRHGWWHGGVTLTMSDGRTQRMLATARIVDDGGRPAYVSWMQPIEDGALAR